MVEGASIQGGSAIDHREAKNHKNGVIPKSNNKRAAEHKKKSIHSDVAIEFDGRQASNNGDSMQGFNNARGEKSNRGWNGGCWWPGIVKW